MTFVDLDLRDLANEWQELLDDLDPEAHDLPATAEEIADLRERCQKYEGLCDALGVSPREPSTLRWYANNYDATLISEDGFEDYARQFAEDIGAIEEDGRWPTYCIDWERAANDLRMDYTAIEYDGDTYLTRS